MVPVDNWQLTLQREDSSRHHVRCGSEQDDESRAEVQHAAEINVQDMQGVSTTLLPDISLNQSCCFWDSSDTSDSSFLSPSSSDSESLGDSDAIVESEEMECDCDSSREHDDLGNQEQSPSTPTTTSHQEVSFQSEEALQVERDSDRGQEDIEGPGPGCHRIRRGDEEPGRGGSQGSGKGPGHGGGQGSGKGPGCGGGQGSGKGPRYGGGRGSGKGPGCGRGRGSGKGPGRGRGRGSGNGPGHGGIQKSSRSQGQGRSQLMEMDTDTHDSEEESEDDSNEEHESEVGESEDSELEEVERSGQGRRHSRRKGCGRSSRAKRVRSYKEMIPKQAKSIDKTDERFVEGSEFLPICEPGPHLPFPEGQQPSDLDVFRLFVSDDMLEHFVKATNSYAEKKKEEKRNFVSEVQAGSSDERGDASIYRGIATFERQFCAKLSAGMGPKEFASTYSPSRFDEPESVRKY